MEGGLATSARQREKQKWSIRAQQWGGEKWQVPLSQEEGRLRFVVLLFEGLYHYCVSPQTANSQKLHSMLHQYSITGIRFQCLVLGSHGNRKLYTMHVSKDASNIHVSHSMSLIMAGFQKIIIHVDTRDVQDCHKVPVVLKCPQFSHPKSTQKNPRNSGHSGLHIGQL